MDALYFTDYFRAIRTRPDRAMIQDAWLRQVVDNPIREQVPSDGRIRKWARIAEYGERALRMILLEDGCTINYAFFDRDFEEAT